MFETAILSGNAHLVINLANAFSHLVDLQDNPSRVKELFNAVIRNGNVNAKIVIYLANTFLHLEDLEHGLALSYIYNERLIQGIVNEISKSYNQPFSVEW